MRAMLAGQIEEAEGLAVQALMIGAGAEQFTAPHYFAIQMFLLRREQGRLQELEAAAREFVTSIPAVPAWRAVFAALLGEIGLLDEAIDEFDALAADGFRGLPHDGNWIAALCVLAELCVQLGDRVRAERLYELLAPFADLNGIIALAIGCLGSVERYLGLLASLTGRQELAVAHLERALEANAALQAPTILAHTQLDLAGLLGAGSPRGTELISAAAALAAERELPALRRRLHALS
jgi:tetratricopeptide (TPR) repeat protein